MLARLREGTLIHCVGMSISAATMEICMEILQKLKTDLPYDPAMPLLGMNLKECKSAHSRDTYVYCSTVHDSQTVESA
jgi:hypothetical protein